MNLALRLAVCHPECMMDLVNPGKPRVARPSHITAIDNSFCESYFRRRWSEAASWPSGVLPVEGEDVTVSSRWCMILDISPPRLGNVYVYGELTFEDQQDYNFTANLVSLHGPTHQRTTSTSN